MGKEKEEDDQEREKEKENRRREESEGKGNSEGLTKISTISTGTIASFPDQRWTGRSDQGIRLKQYM